MKFAPTLLLCSALYAPTAGLAMAQDDVPRRPPVKATLPAAEQIVGFKAIANELAKNNSKAEYKKVVVLDFTGRDETWSPFSDWLAHKLARALGDVVGRYRVIDGSALPSQEDPDDGSGDYEFGSETRMQHLAYSIGADAFISGTYSPAEHGVGLTVDVREVVNFREGISYLSTPRISVNGKILLEKNSAPRFGLPFDAIFPSKKLAVPGQGGVSHPAVLSCPDPQYSAEAAKLKMRGVVLALATIAPGGRATRIELWKGLGHGLDEMAIAALQRWKFEPAVDADGNAVAVRVPVEVTFRLNHDWPRPRCAGP